MNIYWQIFGHLLFVGGSILSLYCLVDFMGEMELQKSPKRQ